MSEDPIKAADLRGYSRGYQAGRKRAVMDDARDEARGRAEAFRQEVYLAIISQMIERPWTLTLPDGTHKPHDTARAISNCAWRFADEAVLKARFS